MHFAKRFAAVFEVAEQPLTGDQLKRAMSLSIATGCGAVMWYAACFPGFLLNVFFKNHLGASSFELGLMVTIIQVSAALNLVSVLVYSRSRTRKKPWFIYNVIHRFFGLLLAALSVHAARGGSHGLIVKIILGAMAVSTALATVSTTGWWTWQTDLYPDRIRATFFGRRSSVLAVASMSWFFAVVVALDAVRCVNIFIVYAVVFAIGALAGIADILFHALIPEPRSPDRTELSFASFFEPLRMANFRKLVLGIGVWNFGVSIFGPFIGPYITSPHDIGAPNTWLGIMFVVSTTGWTFVTRAWGRTMDRFGRKGVVLIGSFSPLLWLGYLALTPRNYYFVLPAMALLGGLIGPLLFEGSNQMMLTLAPQRNKTAFIAWYSTLVGLISSGGSLFGGKVSDLLGTLRYPMGDWFVVNGFHCIVVLSTAICMASIFLIRRIEEPECHSPRRIMNWLAVQMRERAAGKLAGPFR